MVSKYVVFYKVIEIENFTRMSELCGAFQSSIGQTVKSLENDLRFKLVDRKDGIRATQKGK